MSCKVRVVKKKKAEGGEPQDTGGGGVLEKKKKKHSHKREELKGKGGTPAIIGVTAALHSLKATLSHHRKSPGLRQSYLLWGGACLASKKQRVRYYQSVPDKRAAERVQWVPRFKSAPPVTS